MLPGAKQTTKAERMVLVRKVNYIAKDEGGGFNESLILSKGKSTLFHEYQHAGGLRKIYEQRGTYTVNNNALVLSLEATTVQIYQEHVKISTEPMAKTTLTLTYNDDFKGWPNQEVLAQQKIKGWQVDVAKKSLVYPFEERKANGESCDAPWDERCDQKIGYWHIQPKKKRTKKFNSRKKK